MKYKLVTTLVVAGLVVATFSVTTTTPPALAAKAKPTTTTSPPPAVSTFPVDGCPSGDPRPAPPCTNDNVILRWNEQLLATIRANPGGTGPTVASGRSGCCTPRPMTLGRRTARPRPPVLTATRNKRSAPILRSMTPTRARRSASQPIRRWWICSRPRKSTHYDPQMIALYGSNFASDSSAPATVGNKAADAVIAYRHTDGSNQTLNSDNTVSYPYPCQIAPECYNPNNHNKWNDINTPWGWQPLCVLTPAGVAANQPPVRDPNSTCPDTTPTPTHYTVQRPLTPQWGNITPFATSPASIIVTGPPKNLNGTYSNADVVTALNDTSNLDDVKKIKAEYWADGPGSVFPPGHMAVFAQTLSRKNHFTLDKDVQLFFAIGNAVMDAGIAAWWQKYEYDFWRPVTAIRHLYKGKQVNSWLGPGPGPDFGLVDGKDWMPYQALNVVTPNFPEYVSGHSSFSAAGGSS